MQTLEEVDSKGIRCAIDEAIKSRKEGGVPIGASLVITKGEDMGKVIGSGMHSQSSILELSEFKNYCFRG